MKSHPFTLILVLALAAFAVYLYGNYASAEDLKADIKDNSTKIDRILKLQIAESIRGLSVQVCHSKSDSEKRILLQTVEDLQQDYEEIAGSRYPVQACSTNG